MPSNKDAAAIKALQELGLRKDSTSPSPEIQDLLDQLDACEKELGVIDPDVLNKYIVPKSSR